MLRQSLQLKLSQKLSPQQIQLMKLLQVPTVALEQRIKEELEINPALEELDETNEDEFKNEEEMKTPTSDQIDGFDTFMNQINMLLQLLDSCYDLQNPLIRLHEVVSERQKELKKEIKSCCIKG